MRHALLGAAWLTASGMAGERTVTILDEESRGLADARIEVVLTPLDDPRLNSAITRHGATTADGIFRFEADDRLVLTRVRCRRPGHEDADVDHRHGLGRPGLSSRLTLTLPRSEERIPLHYREVRLTGLPSGQWIGFDAAVADAVAPWGKGHFEIFIF